jgi:hypothetical protein
MRVGKVIVFIMGEKAVATPGGQHGFGACKVPSGTSSDETLYIN